MTSSLERLTGIAPFVYAADCGSFVAASEQLNLTGSAISKSVARLEQRLGVRLFERTTRQLKLTDAGQAFYETCTRILYDLAEAESVLAAQKTTPAGRLRIDLPASFGRLKVMPVLTDFCHRHPYLRPYITFTDRLVDLAEEGIDVAVRIGGINELPPAIGHRYLGCERLIFCTTPAYLARRGLPATLGDLADHDNIVYGNANGAMKPWSFPPDVVTRPPVMGYRMMVSDSEAQLAALRAGLGIAQIATWLVDECLENGTFVQVLKDVSLDGLPLHLVWPKNKQLLPKVDALLQALTEGLAIR